MTTATALMKRSALFFIVFAVLSLLFARFLLKFDTLTDFMWATVAAMGVLGPFSGFAYLMVVWWTLSSHGQPVIQSEQAGKSDLDVTTIPQVGSGGFMQLNGRDTSGKLFGESD